MPPAPHGRGNHGSGSAKRKRHAGGHGGGEEGGAERWLVTYADMLTLLLVLFIVLFSVSVVNTSKFISLKTSLAAVFGNGQPGIGSGGAGVANTANTGLGGQAAVPDLMSAAKKGGPTKDTATARAQAAKAAQQKADFARIRSQLQRALKRAGLAQEVRFAVTSRGLVITVVTNALVFPGNSAQLLSHGQRILSIVAPPLSGETRDIEVDGHTNQLKVSTGPYPSGWELSSARASTVVSYLAAHGVAQKHLSAVGWSDQRPLYPASDPRSVTLNRRVEIVVLSNLTTPNH